MNYDSVKNQKFNLGQKAVNLKFVFPPYKNPQVLSGKFKI